MADQMGGLEQASTVGSPMLAQTGLGALPPEISQQFMAQMQEDRAKGDDAQQQRKGALQAYQDAIKAAPDKIKPIDAFTAIGDGMYANPNWMWNPAEALASGFQRMNDIQALRRKQAQEAPVQAAVVGYEDAKDISDKYLAHSLTSATNVLPLLAQQMRTTGSLDRDLLKQYQSMYELNYKAAISAGDPNARETAKLITDKYWQDRGFRPDDIQAREFARPGSTTGMPQSVVPPPPGQGQPTQTQPDWANPAPIQGRLNNNADMRAAMASPYPDFSGGQPSTPVGGEDIAAYRKALLDHALPPKMRSAYQDAVSAYDDEVKAAGQPRMQQTAQVPGTPGLTTDQEAARKAKIEGEVEGAKIIASKVPEQALKYLSTVNEEANAARDTKRVLSALDNNLQRLAANNQAGKLGNFKQLISTWKVGFDPDGKLGIASKEDVENAANFEAANKENFNLAIQSARQIGPRATQMEFLRGMENNPNWLSTPKAAQKVVQLMQQGLDDKIDQQKALLEHMQKKDIDPSSPSSWTPKQLMDIVGHQMIYSSVADNRNAARAIIDKLDGKGVEVQKGVVVQPYWSAKYKALVAKMPDGSVRKLNIGSTEE